MRGNTTLWTVLAVLAGTTFAVAYTSSVAQAQAATSYLYDPSWPKTLPNNWKIGGITGLAVDSNDNVWAYNRPNDLTSIELHAELDPPIAECCVRPPSMIHFDRQPSSFWFASETRNHGDSIPVPFPGLPNP